MLPSPASSWLTGVPKVSRDQLKCNTAALVHHKLNLMHTKCAFVHCYVREGIESSKGRMERARMDLLEAKGDETESGVEQVGVIWGIRGRRAGMFPE